MLDLARHGRFAVVTGIGGESWLEAAVALSDLLGIEITQVPIGPGQRYEDPYGTWAGLREIEDGGVLLVRPDLYIAARHHDAPPVRGVRTGVARGGPGARCWASGSAWPVPNSQFSNGPGRAGAVRVAMMGVGLPAGARRPGPSG
jgi:hypothetical protein